MQKNIQTAAEVRLERILARLANGLSNDAEIDTLKNLLWAAFKAIPADNRSQFISKIASIEKHSLRI
jgi:arylamine N-acetyltransferase